MESCQYKLNLLRRFQTNTLLYLGYLLKTRQNISKFNFNIAAKSAIISKTNKLVKQTKPEIHSRIFD